jgi:hypothetical protein
MIIYCGSMPLSSMFKWMTILDSTDSTLYPSPFDIVFKSLWRYIPEPLLHYVRYLPSREYRRFREYSDGVRDFSRNIIKDIMSKGDGQDIMSVLLRANSSENLDTKMSDDEVVDQIACVINLGHLDVPCSRDPPAIALCSLLGMIPPPIPRLGSSGRLRSTPNLRIASARRSWLSVRVREGDNSLLRILIP